MFRPPGDRGSDLTRPLLVPSHDEEEHEEPTPDIIEMHGGYQAGEGSVPYGNSRWYGVKDLDKFSTKVYHYYVNKGFWPTILKRTFNLTQLLFIVGSTTVLVGAVDYGVLLTTYDFAKAVSFSQLARLHPLLVVCLVVFGLFWLWQVAVFLSELRGLFDMRDFYREALHIPDADMETLLWHEVVRKLIEAQKVHRFCRVKADISEHDIANRIMRRENFLIALFNKDILPMKMRMPIFGRTVPFLPKSLEWSINKCVLDHVFDHKHRIQDQFLQEDRGDKLAHALTQRFRRYALINMLLAPFMAVFLIVYFFFRYAEEFRRNPRTLGMRHWSSYLRWKAREFNELPHIFHKRLSLAYLPAENYINSFTSEVIISMARFTAFITGAILAVLVALTLYDEHFLQVHLTPDRSVVWYVGVLGGLLAVSRGMIPDEHAVFDPETHMAAVVCNIHYVPPQWKGHFHSLRVKEEFEKFFEYKALFLLSELAGAFVTPVILWAVMPSYSREIIDFFRHFTVYKDGVGHVCSFAMFDFKRHGNAKYGVPLQQKQPTAYEQTAEGKMEKSFLNFKTHHPSWQPPPEGQGLLDNLDEFSERIYQDELENSRMMNPPSPRISGPLRPGADLQASYLGVPRQQFGRGGPPTNQPGYPRPHGFGHPRAPRRGFINAELLMDGASIHEATHTINTTPAPLNEDDAIGNLGLSTLVMEQLYDYKCLNPV